MAQKKESFFWTSYSDLMTSLFFIMLTLFVLVIVLLHKRMEATEQELDNIKKVQQSTKDLSREYFEYNPKHEKYVLKVKYFFPTNRYDIDLLSQGSRDSLDRAGKEIENFLMHHTDNQYILIIEGQASKDDDILNLTDHNYKLSFQRAYSLMKFWKDDCGINFGNNCEVQIAGSGDGKYNIETMRDPVEINNQRFLIHIIPKNIIENEKK